MLGLWIVPGGSEAVAQQLSRIDSLKQELQPLPQDTNRVRVLNQLAYAIANNNPDSSLYFADQALILAEKLGDAKGRAIAKNNRGDYFAMMGQYDSSLVIYRNALEEFQSIGEATLVANSNSDIALVHFYQGNYGEAVSHHLTALKVYEQEKDTTGIMASYQNVGAVFYMMEDFVQATEYFEKTKALGIEIGDQMTIANANINLGNITFYKGDYDKTIALFEASAKLYVQKDDLLGASQTYNNLSVVCTVIGKEEEAEAYLMDALQLAWQLKDPKNLSASWSNIAGLRMEQKRFDEATQAADSVAYYAEHGGGLDAKMSAEQVRYEIASRKGDYKTALKYRKAHATLRDSMMGMKAEQQVDELQQHFLNEQKEAELLRLAQEKARSEMLKLENDAQLQHTAAKQQAAELQQNILWIILILGGIGAGLAILYLAKKSRRNKLLKGRQLEMQRRADELKAVQAQMQAQKATIHNQSKALKEAHETLVLGRDQLKARNHEMMSSMRYAERIQRSMLPSRKHIKQLLPASFILFQPKELVSGDFYWVEHQADKVLFAAIDCTGHGIPGAFVSMVGNSGLNRAVKEIGLSKPSEILDNLAVYFEEIFAIKDAQPAATTIKDGMDMCFCTLHRTTNVLEYAGAYNSLYIVRHRAKPPIPEGTIKAENETHVLYEIPADRQPVGRFAHRGTFTNHHIQLETGDLLYLFSDGFPDQFGGPKGKKYKYAAMRRFMLSNQHLPMEDQGAALKTEYLQWKGTEEQVDDTIIMGVRV